MKDSGFIVLWSIVAYCVVDAAVSHEKGKNRAKAMRLPFMMALTIVIVEFFLK